ncbi:MAG TPA: four helix bundle protein [Anaerolineales bacterium]|nr:four helix bundle protein [Anaerolineales bacterium]
MHNFRELKVWQRGMKFTVAIYRESRQWPQDERFGLISQIRRAASSIPLNIAEGAGNSSDKEFCRYLEMALRSAYEVMTAIDIARGLEFLADKAADDLQKECDEIAAMLVGLMKSLGWRDNPRSTKK